MRYKLDVDGYIKSVAFGCYLDNCTEYTGTVPTGYSSLNDWSENAYINAYYLDADGNLTLDSERLAEIKQKEAQELIDNTPLVRKDLYGSDAVLDSQYIKQTETGEVIVLEDIKTIAPRVKLTGIGSYDNLSICTQGKNMMPCSAQTLTEAGVTFTKNENSSLTVKGFPTADIEYTVAGSSTNTTPLFVIKKNQNYYLNLGGLPCELRYFDGETTMQQYVGPSGLLNLSQSIKVTEVVIKITGAIVPSDTLYPSDTLIPIYQTDINTTFYPQLEYGSAFTSYEAHKSKVLNIDFSELGSIDYILIESGVVKGSVNGVAQILGGGNVGLYSAYNTIYATEDATIEIEYSDNLLDVDSLKFLQGKATTTNKFKILEDGSIEAHNGYFSGRIEADSGYFKGEISWEQITGNENVAYTDNIPTDTNQLKNSAGYTTMTEVENKGYQTEIQVTKITKDTVTAPFVKTLGLTVGNEIQMGENATISWANVTNQPTIPTNTNQLTNGAGYTTMTAVEEKGYQNASQVTQITKDTVTTSYVNALSVKAGSVDAENITGTTIKGKVLEGVTGEFEGKITAESGKIGGFNISSNALYYGSKTNLSSNLTGIYIGADGISVGAQAFKVTADGDIYLGYQSDINTNGAINFQSLTYSKIKYAGTELMSFDSYGTTFVKKITVSNGDLTLSLGDLIMNKSTSYIKSGTLSDNIKLEVTRTHILSSKSILGSSTGYVGFFGSDGKTKQTVANITTTSTATASTVATKLNDLLTALRNYGLIG